jgi:hypothetical protein
MAAWPTSPKAIKARIASYRRILRQEHYAHGMWGDGYGKRYWLFHLYFQLREDTEVRAYTDWYRANFPDDIGEASSLVCWALILHRLGREDEAIYRFVQAIDEKLPVVADLVGDLHAPYGIFGEDLWQFYRVDATVVAAMTDEERAWLHSTWWSPAVTAMRKKRIANGRAFAAATTREERVALSKEQDALVQAFRPKEIPPLSAGTNWLETGRQSAKRSSRKVINTTPDIWKRDGSPAEPVLVPHEIVVRFPDRGPLRIRSLVSRAEAEQAARRMIGKIIVGDGINVSLRTASGFVIVPDGQGPAGAEVFQVPRE